MPGHGHPFASRRSARNHAFSLRGLALQNRLQALQIALLRSGGRRRQILSPEEQSVQAFGVALFEALFTGEVRTRYDVSQVQARQEGLGLRLKLRIHDPQLAALPWEFLYDPRQREYICLARASHQSCATWSYPNPSCRWPCPCRCASWG